jgi:hypothetical protein
VETNQPKHGLHSHDLKNTPIYIVGVIRNVSKTIELEIQTILDSVSDFYKIYWYLVESDSDDDTAVVLESLSKKYSNFNYVSLGTLQKDIPLRTARLAWCRNKYMEYLDANLSGNEFVMVADLDGANLGLTRESIRSIWSRSDWSVVCANQRHAYFDIWALRHEIWCAGDWITEYRNLTINKKMSSRRALKRSLYSKMRHIPSGNEWIPVRSAFGGLAIYKAKSIKALRYQGLSDYGEEVCEHVSFNESITSKGLLMFIVPSLINCDISTHTQILRISVRLKTQIKRMLRSVNQ